MCFMQNKWQAILIRHSRTVISAAFCKAKARKVGIHLIAPQKVNVDFRLRGNDGGAKFSVHARRFCARFQNWYWY